MGEYVSRMQERYKKSAVPALMKEFSFTNPFEVPRLEKVVVNMGLGEAISNNKLIEAGVEEMTAICGQKPIVTKAKKSIASFKLREGQAIGIVVTLRRDRMYDFVDRLVTLALPRVRDFRGVSPKSFDGRGNYTLGMKEHIVFPEINYDRIDKIKGLSITFATSARTDEHGRALLRELGMPFRK